MNAYLARGITLCYAHVVHRESSKLELTIINEEALIQQGFYKKVLDENKVLEAYLQEDYKEFILQNAKVEKVINIKPSKLRINKRKSVNNLDFTSDEFNSDVA